MSVFTVHLLVLTPFGCDSHQLLKGAQKPASAQLRVQRWTDGKKAWCVCACAHAHVHTHTRVLGQDTLEKGN